MLVLARRDERSREEAEAKALGAKTLGAKAPKAKALETEALEAKEDEREAEVGAAKMPRVQKKRRTQAEGTSYTVGSLAKLAGVTVRALHHYEDEGLLHPRAHGQRLSPLRCGGCGAAAADSAAEISWISLEDIREMTIRDPDSHFMLNALNVQLKLVQDRIEQMQLVEKH